MAARSMTRTAMHVLSAVIIVMSIMAATVLTAHASGSDVELEITQVYETIDLDISEHGCAYVDGSGPYRKGDTVRLIKGEAHEYRFQPDDGYVIGYLGINGSEVPVVTYLMTDGRVKCVFDAIPEKTGGGSLTGDGCTSFAIAAIAAATVIAVILSTIAGRKKN